jgi:AcrR family transcriptional regulator
LVAEDARVTFAGVARYAGTTKATLYRHPELRAIVEEHRSSDREAHSLSAIVIQLDLLRQGLESVAAKVRRNEEEFHTLQRKILKKE